MAQTKPKAQKPEVAPKSKNPYLFFLITLEWRDEIAGVSPARPTLPDHIRRQAEGMFEAQERLRKKAKPSEDTDDTNGSFWDSTLKEALKDPALDRDARAVLTDALAVVGPGEQLSRHVMRATNTFAKDENGNLSVPVRWFYGCMKAALEADGVFDVAAQKLVNRGVVIYPKLLDLGKKEHDDVHNANVTTGRTGQGEAQSSIKRFETVSPQPSEFQLIFQILDSPATKLLLEKADNLDLLERTLTIMGSIGVGGCRPEIGKFELVEIKPLAVEQAKEMIRNGFGPKHQS